MTKQNGRYATKADLDVLAKVFRKDLDEAADAILAGVDKIAKHLNDNINEVKKDVTKIKTDLGFIKQDIRDIGAELSTTVSKREFNEFKRKVLTS